MTRIKICGITSPLDARLAARAGADAIGLVFARSERQVTVPQAREIVDAVPPFVTCVAVFMDAACDVIRETCLQVGVHTLQLHGLESPEQVVELRREFKVIKAVHLASEGDVDGLRHLHADALIVDSRSATGAGGTGRTCDWTVAATVTAHQIVILAGGLSPSNVADAIRAVRPYAVDASSLLEEAPGKKDPVLVKAFVQEVRRVDRELERPSTPTDATT